MITASLTVAARLDEDLGAHAIRVVDEFVHQNVRGKLTIATDQDWPIRRSQIAGLRLIATNEPDRVGDFAKKQHDRENAKRADREVRAGHEGDLRTSIAIEFWKLVLTLCAPGAKDQVSWSLQHACDEATPIEYRDADQTPNAKLTVEQRQERNRRKSQRQEFQRRWKAAYYPAFFQRFCAHYLYTMSLLTQTRK
jgi:hypothetical protein